MRVAPYVSTFRLPNVNMTSCNKLSYALPVFAHWKRLAIGDSKGLETRLTAQSTISIQYP